MSAVTDHYDREDIMETPELCCTEWVSKRSADAAIAELEARAAALYERRLPCREAEIAQKRYEDAEAMAERLKCCGNCAESHDIDNDFMCECWPDMNEAKSEDDKPTDVCPGDSCHYTPTRWVERSAP